MSAGETPHFMTGVHNGWHAIDAEPFRAASGCDKHAWSLCGMLVRVAGEKYQPYDPATALVSLDPCPDCRWAIAAATDTYEAALAELAHPLAHDIAAMILNVAARDADDDVAFAEPGMLQLLAAVSRHVPVSLIAEGCSDGDCEHDGKCPESLACRACSLQAGDWAGEWQGQYRSECTIPGPVRGAPGARQARRGDPVTVTTLDAAAKGRLAERLVPVAMALIGVVRDQDAGGIGEFLKALSDEEREALPVILAAMVPDDKTPHELLAWVDFDEYGAPLPQDVQMVLFSPRQYRRTAPVQPCGTPAAVRRHYDHGEQLCEKCRPVRAAMRAAGRERSQQRREAAA